MKRTICFILAVLVLLSLCGCQGTFGSIDLQDVAEIPADGVISKSTIKKIKDDNAIATFAGESNGVGYEWTIFGSDIEEAKEINLLINVEEITENELRFSCEQKDAFGFPALLSIHTNQKWDALSATAYRQAQALCSVSLTGNKTTVLNLSMKEGMQAVTIRPDRSVVTADDVADVVMPTNPIEQDDYLSRSESGDGRVYSDGKGTGQDQYLTDPIPEGKPMPVEPENQDVDTGTVYTCTFSIECSTILNNLGDLDPNKLELVPSDGVILARTTVTFYEGESVFDVLQRVCREHNIHMEASWTPMYNSAYVEGIHNLYEFDCGSESGWMYRVNGWYPNYGCSRYQLVQGDIVEWRYTCKGLGKDIGCDWMW